jgi:hypothetical protein
MIIILKNTTSDPLEIKDLNSFYIEGSAQVDIAQQFPLHKIASSNYLVTLISNGTLVVNDGEKDLATADAIKYVSSHVQLIGPKDRSGKIRIHQTSRKLGTVICWSGTGDDPSDVHKVWGGEATNIVHKSGDAEPLIKYIDLNCVYNETWLHEGYLTWKGGELDTLTLEMVPRVTATSPGEQTNYNLHNGYLIIPANGDGTLSVDADLTDPNAGLIYMPDGDEGEAPTAFWDAEYDPTTKKYKNITPNPYGKGRYNMFSLEITFARFVNAIPLHKDGFIALNSSDTDQLGHGMRLRITGDTNMAISGDHDWSVAFILCLHREKTI